VAAEGMTGLQAQYSWLDAFLGNIPGSIGETSTLAVLIGGAFLLLTRVASWRVVAGVFLGMFLFSSLLNLVGSDSNPAFAMPWYWHLVVGGFAFGMLFMATDPGVGGDDRSRPLGLRHTDRVHDRADPGDQPRVPRGHHAGDTVRQPVCPPVRSFCRPGQHQEEACPCPVTTASARLSA
jgi:hypothetical protein